MKNFLLLAFTATFIFASAAVVQAVDFEDISINGFISQGYMKSDNNNFLADTDEGSFEIRETGVNFATDVGDKLHLGLQFLARDLGDLGNDEVTLDWAFASYRWKDWLGVRAGKMKMPNGLYNETRDVDMLRTSILLPQSIYNESWRDTFSTINGGGLYGELPGGVAYQVMIGTLPFNEDGGVVKTMDGISELEMGSGNIDQTYAASLVWETPLEGLRLSGTYIKTGLEIDAEASMTELQRAGLNLLALTGSEAQQEYATGILAPRILDISLESWTVSAEYTIGDLIVAGEYSITENDIETSRKDTGELSREPSVYDSEGYYLSASYRFTDWFELGAYYSVYYLNNDDKGGKIKFNDAVPDEYGWLKDTALSARFDVTDNWVVKVEGHIMDGLATSFPQDNINPDGTYDVSTDWNLFAVKVTYSF